MLQKLRWKIAQKAELLWWKSYLKNKTIKEYHQWKIAYWNKLLNSIGLKNIDNPANSILDLGCGPGGIFMVFSQSAVWAVDPLVNLYEANLPHFKKYFYPNINFEANSIESFIADTLFDYVFCLNAINHVDDLSLSFDKLVQYLAPSGKLVMSIDAHNCSFLKRMFQLIPGDVLHPHQHDLKEYISMLTQRGCKIESTTLYKEELIFKSYIIVASKNN